MKPLRRFFRLSPGEQWLLLKAAILLGAIRIGLRLLSFQTLKRLLDSASKSGATHQFSSGRIVWAVTVVGRYVLGDKPCLPQALVVQLLLKRRGYPASLRIGVAQEVGGQLQAHAWVESENKVMVGGADLSRYTLFPGFAEKQ